MPVIGNTLLAHNTTMQGHTGQGRAMELGQCLLCQIYAALKVILIKIKNQIFLVFCNASHELIVQF